jgi:hypothetical protein
VNGDMDVKHPTSVLYHGTSTRRLKSIIAEQRLRIPPCGVRKVSMTTNFSVAEYFAFLAVMGDWSEHPESASGGAVLGLDGDKLRRRHGLRRFKDPVWGKGECDWENEYACSSEIAPLRDVLLSIEHVPQKRLRRLIAEGHVAVHHRGDRTVMRRLLPPEEGAVSP